MELVELYKRIQNPLDDSMVMEKLINAYINSSNGFGGFYGQLTRTVEKENKGQYYREDADRFYSMMFNKWKNSVVSKTKDEFMMLYRQGSYGLDFIKMRSFLKNIQDVSTLDEVNSIVFGKKGDKELEDALEKYIWDSLGEGSGWVHVCSRYVTAKKDSYPNVEHRLYLNTDSLDIYKMVTYFVEKCDKHHLPYYFKFDQMGSRDDTIVIYSSTENITKYIDILQEIKKEYPELVSRIKEPPILTGKIDGWIGYGSEPMKTPDGKNNSFNGLRSKIIESAFDNVTKKWIFNNLNRQINYHGKQISFQDYFFVKATSTFISRLEERFKIIEDNAKRSCSRKGKTYDSSQVISDLGYSLKDIQFSQFQESVYQVLSRKMENSLANFCYRNQEMEPIVMQVRNNRKIYFNNSDLERTIHNLVPKIRKKAPNFIEEVKNQINVDAKKAGIDGDKFCFDIHAKKRLESVSDLSNKRTKSESILDKEHLDIFTFPQIINPTLMGQKMLCNGNSISSTQYVQEIVYPHLPQSGIVILSNGAVVSAKQFVEEFVMGECQKKYAGDFSRYYVDKTKSNLGIVSIEKDGEKLEISPTKITEFINPALLNRRVSLPNNIQISAKQYIEEFYASHIPSNGRVILKNNLEMPVTQYIEDILLQEGQEKYHGDIAKILFYTTKQNFGSVNKDSKKMQQELINLRKQVQDYKKAGKFSEQNR